jgi:hypothetical protein
MRPWDSNFLGSVQFDLSEMRLLGSPWKKSVFVSRLLVSDQVRGGRCGEEFRERRLCSDRLGFLFLD